jgi:putative Holliday junction resolvase
MQYLGVDYGTRRIGLAISDTVSGFANPLTQLAAKGHALKDAEAVADILREYVVDAIVVGLPLNMDDSEGPQAKITREFGKALESVCEVPIEYWDERLTTHAADALLAQRDNLTRKKRKARRDALAAQVMLQSFLDTRKQNSKSQDPPSPGF